MDSFFLFKNLGMVWTDAFKAQSVESEKMNCIELFLNHQLIFKYYINCSAWVLPASLPELEEQRWIFCSEPPHPRGLRAGHPV